MKAWKLWAAAAGVFLVLAASAYAGKWTERFRQGYWYLTLNAQEPDFIVVDGADLLRTRYLYIIYTLTNESENPIAGVQANVVVIAGTGKEVLDRNGPAAKALIEKRVGHELLTEHEAAGAYKPGQKKEIVAIFPVPDPNARTLTFQFRGLTNHYKLVVKDSARQILKRVYEMVYYWPGDAAHLGERDLEAQEAHWSWRAIEPKVLDPKLVEES